MWLVGVVIRRYIGILIIIINFPYSTCIRSFFGSSILTSLFIFKCFFGLVYIKVGMLLPKKELIQVVVAIDCLMLCNDRSIIVMSLPVSFLYYI